MNYCCFDFTSVCTNVMLSVLSIDKYLPTLSVSNDSNEERSSLRETFMKTSCTLVSVFKQKHDFLIWEFENLLHVLIYVRKIMSSFPWLHWLKSWLIEVLNWIEDVSVNCSILFHICEFRHWYILLSFSNSKYLIGIFVSLLLINEEVQFRCWISHIQIHASHIHHSCIIFSVVSSIFIVWTQFRLNLFLFENI